MGDARHDAVDPDAARPEAPGAAGDTALPGAAGAPAPGHGRAGAGRHRRRRSHRGLLLLTVVLLGGTLVLLAVGDRWLFAGGPAAQPSGGTTALRSPALAPPPAAADTPAERLDATTTAVADALAGDPDALGAAGEGLLASLRQVQAAEGPARRLAAVVVSDSVTTAVSSGSLEETAGRQVLDTLAAVARPERLIDLVQTVERAPLAIGPAGPELHGALVALDHDVPAEETAPRAAELLAAVTTAAAGGRVSESFRAVAVPTLERLADPSAHEDLQELLAAAERDPGRIGPAAPQVLASLRAAAGQAVWPQGNTALDLLALLRQDGQVTAQFREEAVPVVEALVR